MRRNRDKTSIYKLKICMDALIDIKKELIDSDGDMNHIVDILDRQSELLSCLVYDKDIKNLIDHLYSKK